MGCHPATASKHLRACGFGARPSSQLLVAATNDEVRAAARRHPDSSTLRWAAAPLDDRLRAARSRFSDPTLLRRLACDGSAKVRIAVAGHRGCPPQALARMFTDWDADVRSAVARNRNCPAGLLVTASRDRSPAVRMAAASNHSTPVRALRSLAADRDDDVCAAVARHPAADIAMVTRIASRQAGAGRDAAIQNPLCPPGPLRELALSTETSTWPSVAGHRNTPVEVLAHLAGHGSYWVHRCLADRADCPPEVLAQLAASPAEDTRRRVARHPATPPEVLERFAMGLSRDLSALAHLVERLDCPPRLLQTAVKSPAPHVRAVATRHPATTAETLATSAADPDGQVREAAALNWRCPPAARDTLRADPDPRVRTAAEAAAEIIANPAAAARGLLDRSRSWRHAAAQFSGSPPALLTQIARSDPNDQDIPYLLARNTRCPEELLVEIVAKGGSAAERAVRHPNCPQAVLEQLAASGDHFWSDLGRRHLHARKLRQARAAASAGR